MKFRYGKKCNCGRVVTCNVFDCPDAKYDKTIYPDGPPKSILPQPQQKEQFSRELTCEFAEWYSELDKGKYGHRNISELLTEYLNSKTKP